MKMIREDRRQREQLQRRQLGVGQAARVDSSSGQGAGWVDSPAAAGGAEMLTTATPEGPPLPRGEVGRLELTDADEHALARYRLGLFERAGGCRRESKDPRARAKACPLRNDASVTAHHLTHCPFGGWIIIRHNRLARLLQMLVLGIAGAEVHWTPRPGHWRRGEEAAEPDLRIEVPGWATLHVDVAVVTPNDGPPGCAARDAERTKKLAYPVWVKDARVVSCDFSPFVVETFGRFGECARHLIGRLAARAAAERRVCVSAEIARWQQLLALRLMKDEADLLVNG